MKSKSVIGVENVDYEGKNGHVKGVNLYISDSLLSPSIGVRVSQEFIRDASISDFKLGEIVTVTYEKGYGNFFRATGVIYKKEVN